jgi:hypothetical protein
MISRAGHDVDDDHHTAAPSKPLLFDLRRGKNGSVVTAEAADYICPSATEVVHFEPARTDAPHAFGACTLKESCTRRSVGVSTRSVV